MAPFTESDAENSEFALPLGLSRETIKLSLAQSLTQTVNELLKDGAETATDTLAPSGDSTHWTGFVTLEQDGHVFQLSFEVENRLLIRLLTYYYGPTEPLTQSVQREGMREITNVAYGRFRALSDPYDRVFRMALTDATPGSEIPLPTGKVAETAEVTEINVSLRRSDGRLHARLRIWKKNPQTEKKCA